MIDLGEGDSSEFKLDNGILEREDQKEKYVTTLSSSSKQLSHLSQEEILERRRLQNRKSKQKRRSEFHALHIAKRSNDASLMGNKIIKPKRSPSGYQLFTMENAAIIKAAHPGLPFNEVLTIIGRQWKNATDEVKDPYLDKATKLYNVYVKELEEYHIAVAKANLSREAHSSMQSSSLMHKEGLSDGSNNHDSDDYHHHHSMQQCDNNTLLDTRIVVESEYLEALKAENIRLLQENTELKRLLSIQQSPSGNDLGMQMPLQEDYHHHHQQHPNGHNNNVDDDEVESLAQQDAMFSNEIRQSGIGDMEEQNDLEEAVQTFSSSSSSCSQSHLSRGPSKRQKMNGEDE